MRGLKHLINPSSPREWRVRRWTGPDGLVHWTFVDEGFSLASGFQRQSTCGIEVKNGMTLRAVEVEDEEKTVNCFGCIGG